MIGGRVCGIAAVIRRDDQEIILVKVPDNLGQTPVKELQCGGITGRIVSMAVLGICIDEIDKQQTGPVLFL